MEEVKDKIEKFKNLSFPDFAFYNDEVAEWVFDYLLETDSFFGSLIINYINYNKVDNNSLNTCLRYINEAVTKLNSIRITEGDKENYEYIKSYIYLMKEIGELLNKKQSNF